MAEENISNVKEIENCLNTNPQGISEESSVETVSGGNVGDVVSSKDHEDCKSKITEVPKPQVENIRRHSTGAMGTKPQVKSRYHGNHHVSSTHDFCKYGKKCDRNDEVKPWKMVRRKSVEGSDAVKVETSGLRRQSLGSVSKQILDAKREPLALKKKPCASVTLNTLTGSTVSKRVPGLRNDKSNTAMEKVSRISNRESSKVCYPKNLKNKEKAEMRTSCGEDVKEKTVRVVESSIKTVPREKQPSSNKTTMKSGKKNLTMRKESGSADLEANAKPEKKIRPKKTDIKETLAKQLTFKRGKVLDPKPEDSSPRWIKFRKRVVQEKKTQTEGKKKNLKDTKLGAEKNDSCEGSKCEKVVLKHQNVEEKKKMITFNSVIEETMSKLTKLKKTKVKAIIGAYETFISLQDTKPPQKVQSKATTSASKVSPLITKY